MVSKRQNDFHGGVLFSQLPVDVQAQVLSYEISVQISSVTIDEASFDIPPCYQVTSMMGQ